MKRLLKKTLIIMLWIGCLAGMAHGQDDDNLTPYQESVIELAPRQTVHYTFDAERGAAWSFVARAESGDIDPVLRLMDEVGEILIANDNETHGSTTARIESWLAPQTATYTLEIAAENPQQNGAVRLTALPESDSLLYSALPESVELAAGETYPLFERLFPMKSYLAVRFEADNLPFALEMRPFANSGVGGWALIFEGEGVTLQAVTSQSGQLRYRTLLEERADLTAGDYALTIWGGDLIEIGLPNQETLTLTPAESFVFLRADVGPLLLTVPADSSESVTFRQPLALASFYDLLTYSDIALPPVPAGERLYTAGDDPLTTLAELQALGMMREEGGIIFTVPDAMLETSQLGYSTFPVNMARGVEDFVLHFTARVSVGDDSTACGMTFRGGEAGTFAAALFTAEGGAYLMDYEAGILQSDQLARTTPFLVSGLMRYNEVLLVVQGEEATLFINGVKIGMIPVNHRAGGFQFAILVSQSQLSRCAFQDIWAWEMK